MYEFKVDSATNSIVDSFLDAAVQLLEAHQGAVLTQNEIMMHGRMVFAEVLTGWSPKRPDFMPKPFPHFHCQCGSLLL